MDERVGVGAIDGKRFIVLEGPPASGKSRLANVLFAAHQGGRLVDLGAPRSIEASWLWAQARPSGWVKARMHKPPLAFPECSFEASGDAGLDDAIVSALWETAHRGGDYFVVVHTEAPEAAALARKAVPQAQHFRLAPPP